MYDCFLQFCKDNGYTPISQKEEIFNNTTKIKYICPLHGEKETAHRYIISGKKCRECSYMERKTRWDDKKEERVEQLYQKLVNKCAENGYELVTKKNDIGTYRSYIEYECPIHGLHRMKIGNLLSGKKCPDCQHQKCSERLRLSQSEVISQVEQCGGQILNPEDYINNSERNLEITCPRCGNIFTTSLVLFTQHGGQLCQDCYRKESIGENKIRKFLETHNIRFNPEHWFNDCRDQWPLRFDFYLPEMNTVIEFDGEQHYVDNHYFDFVYDTNKKHDAIKNEYCEQKGISMIRIPYWDMEKIEAILIKHLFT